MRRRLGLWALLASVVLLWPGPVSGAAVRGAVPFWWQDEYTDAAGVDPGPTSAALDTAGTGTVLLPYRSMQLAFDPVGSYVLAATPGGVGAYYFDGAGVRPLPAWDLGSTGAAGVAWVDGGTAFAVSTGAQLAVYGIDAAGQATLAAAAVPSGSGLLAPGPADLPSAVLAATPGGAQLYAAQGTALVPLSGGPGGIEANLGVAATADGAVAATWQAGAVQLWAWDGAAYLPAPAWNPPAPEAADGPVVGVAFFAQGGGFWVLTRQGQLWAYAYGTTGLTALTTQSLSLSALPDPPAGLAVGWGPGSVAALYPTGWTYADPGAGGTLAVEAARGLSGQRWPAFAATAALRSIPLPAGHAVSELRVEDADCAAGALPPDCSALPQLPPGTALSYALSTDGCATWTPAALFTNVALAPGQDLCYQITLRTTDSTQTPRLDVTDLYEVAARVTAQAVPALLCTGAGC